MIIMKVWGGLKEHEHIVLVMMGVSVEMDLGGRRVELIGRLSRGGLIEGMVDWGSQRFARDREGGCPASDSDRLRRHVEGRRIEGRVGRKAAFVPD